MNCAVFCFDNTNLYANLYTVTFRISSFACCWSMIDVLVTSFRQDGIGVGLKIFTRSVHSKVGQAAFVVHAGQDSSFIGFSTGV